jgi:hypothetical protein
MYAWNGVMWDLTYLFICFDGLAFKPADSDGFEVYSNKEITSCSYKEPRFQNSWQESSFLG